MHFGLGTAQLPTPHGTACFGTGSFPIPLGTPLGLVHTVLFGEYFTSHLFGATRLAVQFGGRILGSLE